MKFKIGSMLYSTDHNQMDIIQWADDAYVSYSFLWGLRTFRVEFCMTKGNERKYSKEYYTEFDYKNIPTQ